MHIARDIRRYLTVPRCSFLWWKTWYCFVAVAPIMDNNGCVHILIICSCLADVLYFTTISYRIFTSNLCCPWPHQQNTRDNLVVSLSCANSDCAFLMIQCAISFPPFHFTLPHLYSYSTISCFALLSLALLWSIILSYSFPHPHPSLLFILMHSRYAWYSSKIWSLPASPARTCTFSLWHNCVGDHCAPCTHLVSEECIQYQLYHSSL